MRSLFYHCCLAYTENEYLTGSWCSSLPQGSMDFHQISDCILNCTVARHSYLSTFRSSLPASSSLTCTCDFKRLDPTYWIRIGQEELSRALNRQTINRRAKNVILFVGDGMGVTTVTAARIHQGQRLNKSGEEGLLFFEQFPNMAHAKVK